nr:VOC family protein [Pseudomonas sp. P42]
MSYLPRTTARQRFQKLTLCLWFDNQAEAAARFYCSIFDDAKITGLTTDCNEPLPARANTLGRWPAGKDDDETRCRQKP